MTMEFKTGQLLELHTPAHPYVDAQLGWTDRSYIIPEKTERLRVKRVTRRAGLTLSLRRDDDNTGFNIDVAKWLNWRGVGRTLKVVEG